MALRLSVKIGKLILKNPVMVASGTFGYGDEYRDFMNLKELGAIVTKTITLNPRKGNPAPRTCETPAGLLNSIGLENPGIDNFISQKIPFLCGLGIPIIVSIASEDDPAEFMALARRLDTIKEVMAIELNISCPNIRRRNSADGFSVIDRGGCGLISQDIEATYNLVKAVRRETGKTIITKLSPNVTSISEIALAAEAGGSDAVSLVNTFIGMSIDVEKRRPRVAAVTAGLSGPAIRPLAIRAVWEVYRNITIPIIGMGGIMDTSSAMEFIIAGASAVSVGTANFINPAVTREIIHGIRRYLMKNKINDIKRITGSLKI
ncbi:MAG: dihydroorotate dehydrogenase [Candidatus Omnitrophota bacterium]